MVVVLRWLLFFLAHSAFLFGNYTGNFLTTWHQIFTKKAHKASLSIDSIIITSDNNFSCDEFYYLTDIYPQSTVTLKDLTRAHRWLMYTNRFKAVGFDLSQDAGNKLIVHLEGNWIFKKLVLSGIRSKKEQYTALYTQREGEVFDIIAHEASIESIKNSLFEKGYYNAFLSDHLHYFKQRKIIIPTIKISPGKRFKVTSITYHDDSDMPFIEPIKQQIEALLLHKRYQKSLLQKAAALLRDALKTAGYLHARISLKQQLLKNRSAVLLDFFITRGKRYLLSYKGNVLFSDHYINDLIVEPNQPEWLFTPDIISAQLVHEYYKRGFWDVEIHARYDDSIDNRLVLTIHEHEPIIIEQARLINQHTHADELSVDDHNALCHKRYDKGLIDDMKQKIVLKYQELGFWDVRVHGPFYKKNSATGRYRVTLYLDKGPHYLWSGYTLTIGSEETQTPVRDACISELEKLFVRYPEVDGESEPFNYCWLQEQRDLLISHLHACGYWYARVDFSFEIDSNSLSKRFVRIVWAIDPGEQVTFGKTIIRGTTTIPLRRLLREIKFAEGEAWSDEKIALTRKQLKRLDVFKSIRLYPCDISSEVSKKPIIIALNDDDPIEMRARLGYFYTSKNFTFRRKSTPTLGGSWVIRNLTNRADLLTITTDWSKFEQQHTIDYQLPSFLMSSLIAKARVYGHRYVHPIRIASGDSAYETSKIGLLLGVSEEYKANYFWGITIGNEWIETRRVRGYLNIADYLIDRPIPYFFIEPTLLIDRRDNQLNTSAGTLTFFSCKCMIPEYRAGFTASLLAEHSWYKSFFEGKLILATRGRMGHIFRRAFEDIMPIERFYLGGPQTVRGYEKDTVPPFGVTEKTASGVFIREYTAKSSCDMFDYDGIEREFTIQGGSSMINLNVELRLQVRPALSLVFFQDCGILSQSGFSDFRETFYPSSGMGLRYQTPIGSLRFDIGWKWKTLLPREDHYGWHLTLGQAF